jgi:hypothetical protein
MPKGTVADFRTGGKWFQPADLLEAQKRCILKRAGGAQGGVAAAEAY